MRRLVISALVAMCLTISLASPAAAATIRVCSFADGRVAGQVSATIYPANSPRYRKLTRIQATETFYETRSWAPDRVWTLRYVGQRGTAREWYPSTLPARSWGYNTTARSYTFYWSTRATWGQLFDTNRDCTVTI